MAARSSAISVQARRRAQRSRLLLTAGVTVFVLLLGIVGWSLVQSESSVDPRTQASVDRSYQMLVESDENGQNFSVILSIGSDDAVVTGFETTLLLLPSNSIQTPMTPRPTFPEARGPRQTLRQLLQKISLISVVHAQVNSPIVVTTPLEDALIFSYNVESVENGAWRVQIKGQVRPQWQQALEGRVTVAQFSLSEGQTMVARFVNQSIRGYLSSTPGVDTELTRPNPRGFSCPAVVFESCPRGFSLQTDPTSGCVACLRQPRIRLPWQPTTPPPESRLEFSCIQVYQPVCSQGQTYGNECEARRAGIQEFSPGPCPVTPTNE